MNSFEGNTPPLTPPPTPGANPARKCALEENSDSEQKAKRRRLEDKTFRIYTSIADAMEISENDPAIQQLENRIQKLGWDQDQALMEKIDLAYETGGALPISTEFFLQIKDYPEEFWNKWLALQIDGIDTEYILLTKKDIIEYLPLFDDCIDTKVSQFPSFENYNFSDYVRFFKGMKLQNVSQYNLEETLKLFTITIHYNQNEIVTACEQRIIELLNENNVGEIADRLPFDLKQIAPLLHTEIQDLLWQKVHNSKWSHEIVSAFSEKEKHFMDAYREGMGKDNLNNVAKYFSSSIKKLFLRELNNKNARFLKDFTVLKELKIGCLKFDEIDYMELVKNLKMTNLDSIAFGCINLLSIKEKVLAGGNYRLVSLNKLRNLFPVFNSVVRLELPFDIYQLILQDKNTQFDKVESLTVQGYMNDYSYHGVLYNFENFPKLKTLHWRVHFILEVNPQVPSSIKELILGVYSKDHLFFVNNFTNIEKLKLVVFPEADLDLRRISHLSMLKNIHIKGGYIGPSELNELLKLINLTHITIQNEVHEQVINALIELPNLKSFACKKEFMTDKSHQYALEHGISLIPID